MSANRDGFGRRAFLARGLSMIGLLAAGGSSRLWSAEIGRSAYRLAPESVLASDIRRASPEVREAYRFAIANQEVLRYIPCYCGCGSEGHTSNASCYLKEGSKPGNLIFDRMSLAWDICIGITRDVMKMLDQNKPLKEIRAYIDRTYSRFGPATPTPPVS